MADSKRKAVAFVLPEETTASTEPQQIPGLPGLWTRGEPVHPSALGLSVSEMRERNAAANSILREVKISESEIVEPDLSETAGLISSAASPSAPMGQLPRSASEYPGLSAEEAAERDAYRESRAIPEAQRTMVDPALAVAPPASDDRADPSDPIPSATLPEGTEALPAEPLGGGDGENATTGEGGDPAETGLEDES